MWRLNATAQRVNLHRRSLGGRHKARCATWRRVDEHGRFRPIGKGPRAMALARKGSSKVCRHSCARTNFSMGFPTPTRAGARRARDRGALGSARGGSNARSLDGTRDRAPAHFLPAVGGCSPCAVASRRWRLILRVERPCAILGFGRRCAAVGKGRLELSTALGRGRAAG